MFASPKFSAYRDAPQSESESEDEERCLTRREQRASPQAEDSVLFVCGSVKAAPEPFNNSHIGFQPLELDCDLRDKPQPMEVRRKVFTILVRQAGQNQDIWAVH